MMDSGLPPSPLRKPSGATAERIRLASSLTYIVIRGNNRREKIRRENNSKIKRNKITKEKILTGKREAAYRVCPA